MYRELHEETGLLPEHVKVVGRTRDWLRYEVPDKFIKREVRGHYRGQKQIWFLLRMVGRDCDICLRATDHPEFDAWRWNEYWVPLDCGDRVQAGRVSARADRAVAFHAACGRACGTRDGTMARATPRMPDHDDRDAVGFVGGGVVQADMLGESKTVHVVMPRPLHDYATALPSRRRGLPASHVSRSVCSPSFRVAIRA